MTTIAIIKDCRELSAALASSLNETGDFYVMAMYYYSNDALQGLQENPVDIAIIDVRIDGSRGIELIAQLVHKKLCTKYLVFTASDDNETIFNALRAGADGYILKDAHFEQLKEALHELMRGGAPMSSFVASKVLNFFHSKNKVINLQMILSDREKEILHFVSRGLLYKEIAVQLGIQRETVKKHLSKIYSKLQVQNKVEALNKVYNL